MRRAVILLKGKSSTKWSVIFWQLQEDTARRLILSAALQAFVII